MVHQARQFPWDRRCKRFGWVLTLAFCSGHALSGCDDPAPESVAQSDASGTLDPGDAGGDAGAALESYSLVVLPDTQYYASNWPDVFAAQTRWVVQNRQAERIAAVLHTGDIVDSDVSAQWDVAASSLGLLDGEVPYVITAGNHDYTNLADRMGMGSIYFPPWHFAQFPWFGGTFEPGHVENSFSMITRGAAKWVVLALEFGPRNETLAWADAVLKAFRDWPAIVITHAYLYFDGTRYDHTGPSRQYFNPHDYVMMGQAGTSVNDGEEMWQKLIAPNSNVKMVFCGHDVSGYDLPPGTAARLTSTRPDGTTVHQILANYQTCTSPPCGTNQNQPGATVVDGGYGFLRIVRFAPADGTISVTTYSPYLDAYLSDPGNQFTLDLN